MQPPIPAHMFSSPRQFKHAPGSHVVQSLPPPTDPVNAPRKEENPSGGEPSAGIRRPQLAPVPKQRLRWTPELHERFIAAVTHLGGGDSKSATCCRWDSFCASGRFWACNLSIVAATSSNPSSISRELLLVVGFCWNAGNHG